MSKRTIYRSNTDIKKTFPIEESNLYIKELSLLLYVSNCDDSIVPLVIDYGYDSEDNSFYIKSELKHTNLDNILKNKNVKDSKKLYLLHILTNKLIKLHKLGVKHNDVLPCNFVVDNTLTDVFIIDFEKSEFIKYNEIRNINKDIEMYNRLVTDYSLDNLDSSHMKKRCFESTIFNNYKNIENYNIDNVGFKKLIKQNLELNNISPSSIEEREVIEIMLLMIILPNKPIKEIISNFNCINDIESARKAFNLCIKRFNIYLFIED